MELAESIWLDLLALRWWAWLLVLSPYVTVQLARWRPPRLATEIAVIAVTDLARCRSTEAASAIVFPIRVCARLSRASG